MVFLFIIIAIILFAIIIFFSKINIQIINFKFNSQTNKHINEDYQFIVRLYFLGKIPVIKTKITKQKLEEIKLRERFKKINFENLKNNIKIDNDLKKSIKRLNVEIKRLNLKINLGTENSAITSIIVPAISTVIAIILKNKMKEFEDQSFVVNPIYQNQNLINIELSSIFEIKIGNIINIIYNLAKKEKKGVNKYERTSNRRSYDYSYE